jgi:hypothetical protein
MTGLNPRFWILTSCVLFLTGCVTLRNSLNDTGLSFYFFKVRIITEAPSGSFMKICRATHVN